MSRGAKRHRSLWAGGWPLMLSAAALIWDGHLGLQAQQPATGALQGVVTDSVRQAPLAGVMIDAVPEGRSGDTSVVTAVTDGHGAFAVRSLPPGRYTVRLEHSWLDSAGITAPQVDVTIRAHATATVELGTPSAATLRGLVCHPERDDTARAGLAMGTVRTAGTGAPIANAAVVAIWHDLSFDIRTRRATTRQREAAARTDQIGEYRMCGLPMDQTLSLQAQYDTDHYTGLIDAEIPQSGLYVRTFFVDVTHAVTAPSGSGAISGTVRTTEGQAILAARVSEVGSNAVATTDAAGHFHLSRLRLGTQTIRAEAVGHVPTTTVLDLGVAPPDDVVLTMAPMAVRLKGVVTEAERRGTLNRTAMIAPGFYQRFQRGFGVFFLADSIGKLNPQFTSDLFRRTPGFGVYQDALVFSTRPSGDLHGGLCFPDTYIDGTHVGPGEVNLVAPTDILAIEAYQAGQPAPVQFPGHACGEIIIWTK